MRRLTRHLVTLVVEFGSELLLEILMCRISGRSLWDARVARETESDANAAQVSIAARAR